MSSGPWRGRSTTNLVLRARQGAHPYHPLMRATRSLSRAALVAVVLGTVVLGHGLTYLVSHGPSGYDAAMAVNGHERYWTMFILVAATIACALGVVVAGQIIRLRRLAAGRLDPDPPGGAAFRALVARIWRRAGFWGLAIYVLQENLETVTAGHSLPGLGVFGGDHIVALPVFSLIALVLAAVAALVAWRRGALLRRLRSVHVATRRQAPRFVRDSGVLCAIKVFVGSANGVRAPPRTAFDPT